MVVLLGATAAVYLWIGSRTDAIAALVAVAPIAALDVLLETRTERALDQLRLLSAPTARAVRDGTLDEIPADQVVPGDLLEVREGDVISADGHLVGAALLHVDESPLTGESDAIAKSAAADADLFAGTRVLSGRGRMLVSATGMASRYGKVAELLAGVKPPSTPLQLAIRRLFVLLSVVAAVVCIAVVGLELARGTPWTGALIAGIGLAMASIPEEIPIVATLYLGLGAWRLARDHALIRRLSGVETLGMTTVICTDKTGTLTEGSIQLVDVLPRAGITEAQVLEASLLASRPEPFDPLERALVIGARGHGIDAAGVVRGRLVREHPFDPAGKYVSYVWERPEGDVTFAKGSPETIAHLGLPDGAERNGVLERTYALARAGRRLISVASGPADRDDGTRTGDERSLRYLGLLAFADPVRAGAREAIAECRDASVRVIVITGDHPATASAVAQAFGLIEASGSVHTGADLDSASDAELREMLRTSSVFARTRPEQKLRIVRALREMGEVVAVTGDGINDAPALRDAHIGIAMGASGTAVAREAATLVLLDDAFGTIVRSIADGRRIFDNLARAVSYLIAFHIPLILAAVVMPLVGAPLLLLPLHLVWLEVIVHPTSALVFEADPPAADLMRRPPRRSASLLPDRGATALGVLRGLLLTAGVLVLFLRSLPAGEETARTAALAALVAGQTLLVLTARAGSRPLWQGPGGNPIMPWVMAGSVASVALIAETPGLEEVFHMHALDVSGWVAALLVALVAVLGPEITKVRVRLLTS